MSAFNWPTGELKTKLGNVHFARTQADHVSICTESGEFVQVHGVKYHCHLHLFLSGENWAQRAGDRLYLQRDWSDKNSNKPASVAACDTLVNELTRCWIEYATAHPEQADLAERAKLTRDLDTVDEEIAEMESTLNDAKGRRKAINNSLRKLGGRVE